MVLGMHRSGTSAMTRVLSLCGAILPDNIHPAGPDNPKGFWEGRDIIAFNDEVLAAFDTSWDDIFAGRPKHYLSNFDRVFTQRAVDMVEQVFNGGDLVVLKDPRINVLLSFWLRALQTANYDPVPIIMVRHPLEVAASLRERNGFSTEKGLLLWLDNMIALERDTRGMKRLFVSYDALLSSWRECIDQVETVMQVPLPRRTATSAIEIEKFLSPKMRHHDAAVHDIGEDTNLKRIVTRVYSWFQEAARNQGSEDSIALKEADAFLAGLRDDVGTVIADYRLNLNEYIKHTQGLEQLVAHKDAVLEERERQKANIQTQLDELASEVAQQTRDWDVEREQMQISVRMSQERFDQLNSELEQRTQDWNVEREQILASVRASQEKLDQLNSELGQRTQDWDVERDQMLASVHKSQGLLEVSEAETAILTARQRELQSELRRLQALTESFLAEKAETAVLETALKDMQAERIKIEEKAESLGRQLEKEGERSRLAETERAEMETRVNELTAELRRIQIQNEATMVPRDTFDTAFEKLQSLENEVFELRHARLQALPLLREREAIINSTSWKLTLLPRMILSRFRREKG